jgi:probable F420-dependent oxidoreductase
MQRYGMTIPLDDVPLTDQGEVARELAAIGYTDLWSSEAMGADCFIPLAIAAVCEPTLRLGTAIAPAYTRGPALLAQSAATLAASAPGRFVLGVGSSSQLIVEGWNDKPFDKPYARTRDVVRFLRKAFAGERIDEDFETFSIQGFRLGVKADPSPPILVAALREGMLAMAGRESDGAIINWLSAADVATVAPVVRAAGDDKEIVARIMVLATDDTDRARAAGRRLITTYLNVPVYAEFHKWLGRGDDLAAMWKLWAEGDRKAALAAVPDHVVDELVIHGSPESCREQVQAYVDNGVSTPVLALLPTGDDPRELARRMAPA